ncbi:VOC family protein [Streptomyces sp. RFCAC02]|uniref:VOC family protein n=1 Tax=Streptomyces sp. RFCAC02 TaxID=2499143 RepID=UPI001021A388|nr:VOC family protein [Streptomyces sp. RFCAC02]
MSPRPKLAATVLNSPDPRALAAFYERLLGWPRAEDEAEWVKLDCLDGGAGLSFQYEPEYRRPVWPARADVQQMQCHLDFLVDDLEVAVADAVAAGATVMEFQPQDDVRVCADPDGHPFCLFIAGA